MHMDLTDRVALVTGGARGQGRAEALALADLGADVVLVDHVTDYDTVPFPMASPDQLDGTAKEIEDREQRCVAIQADIRDSRAMDEAAQRAVDELGSLDMLVANAGVFSLSPTVELDDRSWEQVISTNLTGTFRSIRAALPHMIEQERGSIVATSSIAGRQGFPPAAHYTASKWGVIGLVKTVAQEVAESGVRINAVCPGNVNTDMIQNDTVHAMFAGFPDEEPAREDWLAGMNQISAMDTPWVEPEDIAAMVTFLLSDQARFITGAAVPVDAGVMAANTA